MSQVPSGTAQPATTRTAYSRRFGYVVAIAINAAMLYVAYHLLDWGWPRFLTDQFSEVLPVITVSLVASVVANAVFVVYDAGWFKSLANAVTAAIAFVVALRLLQVFPFDFTSYAHNWTWLAELVLVLVMIATAIGFVVELIRFLTWPLRERSQGTA